VLLHVQAVQTVMDKRIQRLGIFILLCFGALFLQLNNIQVLKANSLANSPDNPRVIAVAHDQPRGSILSADGVVLASSVASSGTSYKYKRVYNPYTAVLFSDIVGYDSLIYGSTGIEAEYNSYLESHTRPAETLRDLLVNRTTTDNVYLTINSHLQTQVAAAIDATDVDNSAPEAGAVVIDIKTGAIEAMYSNPTFDPTGLASQSSTVETQTWDSLDYKSPQSPLVSRTFQLGFIPGSTFKTVTSSAVYDHDPGLASVNYPVQSCITVAQRVLPLCNYQNGVNGSHESCGGTIQTTLPQSCDTAFAQMGVSLGTNLTTEAQSFGFNQSVPIDLPGVGISTFPSTAALTGDAALQATAAFGQGAGNNTVVATVLQMGLVAAGIANHGVVMTPHVMGQIRDSQGSLVETYQPKPWKTATSPSTAAAVTSLMEAVVTQPGATANQVGFPASWDVAAKTGTAETGGGALGNSLTNDWMIAFAPANDPKVAVAVAIPNQPFSATGAEVSGPPTKTILGDALSETP
jgi:penicillin-binding protein A